MTIGTPFALSARKKIDGCLPDFSLPDFSTRVRLPSNSRYCGVLLSTSTSLLRASSANFPWFLMVFSRTSPVMQKTRSLASVGRWRRPQTTNLAMNGTRIISGCSSDAMRAASPVLGVSTNQKLADVGVEKVAVSSMIVSGVESVTSSHWAGTEPSLLFRRRRSVEALSYAWRVNPFFGSGIMTVRGLLNLRRLGLTVTIGLSAVSRPLNRFVTMSSGIG